MGSEGRGVVQQVKRENVQIVGMVRVGLGMSVCWSRARSTGKVSAGEGEQVSPGLGAWAVDGRYYKDMEGLVSGY